MGSSNTKPGAHGSPSVTIPQTDDLTQPVDLAAPAQFNAFLADLSRTVAGRPRHAPYLDSSFFKRFETAGK